ncbi:hypothetical protein LguiB_013080 [Lonicera macranthoides]
MDCLNNNKYMTAQLTVIPFFYDVQALDVRKHEGHFREIFLKQDSYKVQIWRQALRDATNLSRWDLKNVANGHEAKCIDIVVKEIRSKLPHTISSGSKNIEAILLHPQREQKHIEIAIEAFREMRKLRLLEVHNVWTPRVPEYLSSQLRWLIWEKFPSESLPPRFEADNLVGLQLYYSSIERPWRGEKVNF